METPPTPDRPRETFRAKLIRIYDEWSLYLLVLMFGFTCFALGAATAKSHLTQ